MNLPIFVFHKPFSSSFIPKFSGERKPVSEKGWLIQPLPFSFLMNGSTLFESSYSKDLLLEVLF